MIGNSIFNGYFFCSCIIISVCNSNGIYSICKFGSGSSGLFIRLEIGVRFCFIISFNGSRVIFVVN